MQRNEILANREKVIDFLKQPERKKARNILDQGNDERCCLGHMAFCLGVKRTSVFKSGDPIFKYGDEGVKMVAPLEVVEMVGLNDEIGGIDGHLGYISTYFGLKDHMHIDSLATLNDVTETTPQQIGAYLETVIEGGRNTPWRALDEYKV